MALHRKIKGQWLAREQREARVWHYRRRKHNYRVLARYVPTIIEGEEDEI